MQNEMTSPNARTMPAGFPIGRREFVIMMASLMALNALAIDAMLPAFPAIGEALGVEDHNRRQFLISIYLLGMGLGSLVYGPLADRFGRRPILLIAIASYILFSIASMVAPSFDFLLTMRLFQGLVAAALGVLVVSIIRDIYAGDRMARLMSIIFLVFMAVPVLAPTIGQIMLVTGGWRSIFGLFAVMAALVGLWVWHRLPETLEPERSIPISPASIVTIWSQVIFNRTGFFYVVAAGTVMGAMFGFLNSSQQIFADVFDAADIFPYAFACVAGTMALSSWFNSTIVERFGARRVSHAALCVFLLLSLLQIAATRLEPEPMPLFLTLLAANMGVVGFIGANFGSIAMEPFFDMAGAASSFQSFVRTVMAALIGAAIGQRFDGSTLPLTEGFLASGLMALALILIAEKGRLFRRPHTCPNSPY
ncbi:MAG: multidrug effflux MFS transporter [Blastomonas sp.]